MIAAVAVIVGMGALTLVALALLRGARQADERIASTPILSPIPRERRATWLPDDAWQAALDSTYPPAISLEEFGQRMHALAKAAPTMAEVSASVETAGRRIAATSRATGNSIAEFDIDG